MIEIGGIYKHYKGQFYKVLHLARLSEGLEEVVVYQALYKDFDIWVRPKKMFLESVTQEGVQKPRFEKISILDIPLNSYTT